MSAILDASGKQVVKKNTDECPQCKAGKSERIETPGFGNPPPICGKCGYEFKGREP